MQRSLETWICDLALLLITLCLCQNSYGKWPFIVVFYLLKMVIFRSYVNVYQRVGFGNYTIEEHIHEGNPYQPNWCHFLIFEITFDGDFIIAYVEDGKCLKIIQIWDGSRYVMSLVNDDIG